MNKRKGITLVALVVTIIVLLILAGITIALVLGQDGVVEKARKGEVESRRAYVEDRLKSFKISRIIEQNLKEASTIPETAEIIEMLKAENLVTPSDTVEGNIIYFEGDEAKEKGLDVEKFIWDNTTPNAGGTTTNPTPETPPDISGMQVGDLVTFDPTEGVDPSLLKMTSVVGSAKEGQNVSENGHSEQTLDATLPGNKLTSWYVLEKEGQNITLLSAEPTKKTITFKGGIGYLYAEQELHKLCSIYGHHKLANKELNRQYTYQMGNPEIAGELQTKKIADLGLNTGARSLADRDIEKILR